MLIDQGWQDACVFALLFVIAIFFVIGPLAVIAGADSRVDDVSRRRLGR